LPDLLTDLSPAGVHLSFSDAEQSIVAECGRCEAWWFVQDDDSLEAALRCGECETARLLYLAGRPKSSRPHERLTYSPKRTVGRD
jgi:hypothetical protein